MAKQGADDPDEDRTGERCAEERRAEEALAAQVRFLQTLIDRIPNPVFFKDVEGRYLGCNVAFARFLGRPREEIVGRTVFEIAPPELARVYHQRDLDLFSNPELQIYEAQVRGEGGALRDVIFYKATYADAARPVAGLVGVILDITERRDAERALEQAHQELEHRVQERTAELARLKELAELADRTKTEFLNLASHELRTPLTTLLLAVQAGRMKLRRGLPVSEAQLDAMERNIRRLDHLARGLLDVARLERGLLELTIARTDLRDPVTRAVEAMRTLTPGRSFALDVPQGPVWAEVDEDRIEQVVCSLLDNAVKFSPPGSPVEVSLTPNEAGAAEIAVIDHGPGIAPDQRPHLFERYQRRDRGARQAGMGLGLFLSRQILLRHGGDIRAELAPKETRFVLTLPVVANP